MAAAERIAEHIQNIALDSISDIEDFLPKNPSKEVTKKFEVLKLYLNSIVELSEEILELFDA
jgi:DNA-binding ferritin-like protein